MSRVGVWAIAIVAAVLWLIWALLLPFSQGADLIWKPEVFGQWGDTFGALNALFAAAGFIGLMITLRLQQRQIEDQHNDLDRQGKDQEAAENRRLAEVEDARRRDHIENFERTFFQLLTLFRQLRDEVVMEQNGKVAITSYGNGPQRGRWAFQYAAELLEYFVKSHAYQDMSTREGLVLLYDTEIHSKNENELGPYFRICYSVLRRISEDEILTGPMKARYGNILRSQLSSAELKVLGFNALTSYANNFKEYIEEFRLLKYLRVDELTREIIEPHYDPVAFQGRPDD